MSKETLRTAWNLWKVGETVEAGRAIFEQVPENARPTWAASILRAAIAHARASSPVIDRILRLAANPGEWSQGHEAFNAARAETLRLDRVTIRSPAQQLMLTLLSLAELVAKVAYNGTNPDDEFDEDSGWWIGSRLKDVLEAARDDDFTKSAWSLLTTDRGQHPEASERRLPSV